MPTSSLPRRSSNKAAALIIVLAFVVLLTGIAVAYLSRATTDRQSAHSSFHDTDADLLARSALDTVVGDFKREILNGSTSPAPVINGTTIYVPKDTGSGAAANMVPQRGSQLAAGVPNLIRRSVRADNFVGNPAQPSLASAVNSQDSSANGRSISSTRWNSHYLVKKGDTTTTDSSPIPAFTNATPDWVFVKAYDPSTLQQPGRAIIASPDPLVVGRYAYAVYDEGGLLDINVAGYPIPSNAPASWTTDVGRKGVLAFADLTALPATTNDPPNAMTSTAINQAILFRNYATAQTSSVTLADIATVIADAFNSGAPLFANYYLGNPRIGTSQNFGSVNPTKIGTGSSTRTDQIFATRAELIALFRSGSSLPQNINALQYLGTFSREQNKPSFPLTTAGPTGWPWGDSNRVVLPQRFYLGNLNEVVNPPTDAAKIRTDLGLEFANAVTSGSGPCDSQVRWKYVGQGTTPCPSATATPTPTPTVTATPTATPLATASASPLSYIPALPLCNLTKLDFFQYINYALFGVISNDVSHIPYTLGIGAALIDMYEVENTLISGVYYTTPSPIPVATPTPTPTPTPTTTPPTPTPTPTPTPCDFPAVDAYIVYGAEQTGSSVRSEAPTGISPPPSPDPLPSSPNGVPPINQGSRNAGEFGWSYSILNAANNRNATTTPKYLIDFKDAYDPANNPDPALLDFFTYNSAPVRSGIVSLNTRQVPVMAAILSQAVYGGTSVVLSSTQATQAANLIVSETSNLTPPHGPAMSRADIARLGSVVNTFPFDGTATQDVRDTFARALSETTQTRTWGLLIDLVAQTGHYPPNAASGPNPTNPLANFVVEGEKHYWLHVAIDRFDGTIVGQQLEEVTE